VTSYIALLRAVNVGGTGKLPMTELVAMCERAGFASVRTYIASGNAVFSSAEAATTVKRALEQALLEYAGKAVGVMIRTADEMAEVLAKNPYPDAPGNRTVAISLDQAPPRDALDDVSGCVDEEFALGQQEIYVRYGASMGTSKLRIPVAKHGTARNMNTVAKLAEMGASLPSAKRR
jgi:uncharacterized protein (DUF1697 family)